MFLLEGPLNLGGAIAVEDVVFILASIVGCGRLRADLDAYTAGNFSRAPYAFLGLYLWGYISFLNQSLMDVLLDLKTCGAGTYRESLSLRHSFQLCGDATFNLGRNGYRFCENLGSTPSRYRNNRYVRGRVS